MFLGERLDKQGPEFECSIGHASSLKFLGRACCLFKSYNTRDINLRNYTRMTPSLKKKKKRL